MPKCSPELWILCEMTVCAGPGALLQPQNLRPLLIGCSLMLFQQITGQPSVLYYATQV